MPQLPLPLLHPLSSRGWWTEAPCCRTQSYAPLGLPVHPPTTYHPTPDDRLPPPAEYRLTRAHGYNGHLGKGQSVVLTASGSGVYPAGGVCVVHRPADDTQRFFTGHAGG